MHRKLIEIQNNWYGDWILINEFYVYPSIFLYIGRILVLEYNIHTQEV